MTASKGFVEFLQDQLGRLGPVAVRRMFGGAGVYADGIMFGLVADDTLYFKADDRTRQDFEAEGMQAFSYATKDGRNTIMSYWRVPDRLFYEPDEMRAWAEKALGTARRAVGARSRKKKGGENARGLIRKCDQATAARAFRAERMADPTQREWRKDALHV